MKNQKQQTAVEWYASKINTVVNNTTDALNHNDKELLEQAKEMEKEQEKKTWNNALNAVEKQLELLKQTYVGNK